ncbi:MAG: hypothetical protein B7C54_05700 [Acidimicrobiales bacterium mtb01]|nr:hypothetical protein [Actinomycetota bacterium]TEX46690.1 MAG: hypothetical protein B7C54_05700 [Acidimicrobiales bacterium mtb01]
MTDDIATTIRRLVAATSAPSERSPLEHAAMEAAAEIERLKIAVKRLKAELHAARTDDVFKDYGDGTWVLIGEGGFVLDWQDACPLVDREATQTGAERYFAHRLATDPEYRQAYEEARRG